MRKESGINNQSAEQRGSGGARGCYHILDLNTCNGGVLGVRTARRCSVAFTGASGDRKQSGKCFHVAWIRSELHYTVSDGTIKTNSSCEFWCKQCSLWTLELKNDTEGLCSLSSEMLKPREPKIHRTVKWYLTGGTLWKALGFSVAAVHKSASSPVGLHRPDPDISLYPAPEFNTISNFCCT